MLNRAKSFLEVLTDIDLLNEFITSGRIIHNEYIFYSDEGVCFNARINDPVLIRRYIDVNNLDRSSRFPCNVNRDEYIKQIYSNTLYPSDERVKFLEFIINGAQDSNKPKPKPFIIDRVYI